MDYVRYIREKVGHSEIILNCAGCIIYNEFNQILLHKRRDCEQWGFMGGLVELGESVAEAAVREVFEESGLRVEIDSLYGVYSKYFDKYSNGDKAQVISHIFTAHVVGGSEIYQNEETMELRYFDIDKTPKLFNQQHQDLLDDLINKKTNVFK